jgi:hypothetical protein
LTHLKTEKLTLISHLKLDFYGNLEHDYEKVISAYSKLSKITNSKTYREAIESEISEIESMVSLKNIDDGIHYYSFLLLIQL